MASLAHLCLLLIFLFPLHISTRGEQICESVLSCGEIDIQFPFGLKGANKGRRCSYPGFQLSCHNYSQTILKLPNTGDLVVKGINYEEQTIQVNDPDGCLPKRFLQNLSNSIFPTFMFDAAVYELHNITFLRCPSNITESYLLSPISCLNDLSTHKGNSSNSSSVIIAWWPPTFSPPPSGCKVMSTAVVPILTMPMWSYRPDLITSDIELTWIKPTCGECAARDQLCGFTRNTSHQVGCFSSRYESPGLPRGAKYGLIIGVGIPGLLCIIGLSCFFCSKFKMYTHRRRPSIGLPNHTSILALQPAHFMMGLDGPEIEKFPKTLIGESRRLPKPNDNTCPICLSEYEPKETLRTIPECNHYFHANCIDEWLKMNATCPLCRNSPDAASSTVTPSSSLSISSPLSSSP